MRRLLVLLVCLFVVLWPRAADAALDDWRPVAQCESNMDPYINTGNGFYGALQWIQSTWNWAASGAGRPDLVGVPPQTVDLYTEFEVAESFIHGGGGHLGHWPVCGAYYGGCFRGVCSQPPPEPTQTPQDGPEEPPGTPPTPEPTAAPTAAPSPPPPAATIAPAPPPPTPTPIPTPDPATVDTWWTRVVTELPPTPTPIPTPTAAPTAAPTPTSEPTPTPIVIPVVETSTGMSIPVPVYAMVMGAGLVFGLTRMRGRYGSADVRVDDGHTPARNSSRGSDRSMDES